MIYGCSFLSAFLLFVYGEILADYFDRRLYKIAHFSYDNNVIFSTGRKVSHKKIYTIKFNSIPKVDFCQVSYRRLAVILIDEILPYGQPITNCKCPNDCSKCVDICPYKAIYGVKWDPGKYRNEMIDYKLCNVKRSQLIQVKGRKSACGLCMAVCPYGISKPSDK